MKQKIIDIMNEPNYIPSNIDYFFNRLELNSSKDFTALAKTLNELTDQNIITYNSKGEFAMLEYFNMAKGIIDVKEAGFAFLDTDLGGIFIPPTKLKASITYDEVLVKYHIDKKGRYEGEVVRILKRSITEIIGTLTKYQKKYIIKPVDSKLHLKVFVSEKDLHKANLNDIVKVKITKFFPNQTADGIIDTVYGNKDLPGLDITSLVLSSGIITEFPKEVLDEIKYIPDEVDVDKELKNNPRRKDLREKQIITIDGIDAKDLDDAISVEKLDNGNYLLGVYIADVANYVKEDSHLDASALTRGTSVYLPDRVIPMLPKKLSNGICSLNEKENRLVMACIMEINKAGIVEKFEITEAIIKSTYRMNYDDVNLILEENNQELITKYKDIYPMLKDMQKLAKRLNDMRIKRGAFFFESNEAKLVLDEFGKVQEIKIRVQKTAEKLIEEFMLIANETVSEAMTWLDVPFIYRVHEEPKDEKITRLLLMLSQFGYSVKIKNKKSLPKLLQQLVLDINSEDSTSDQATNAIINKMMIRSMAKAKYQETNIGHFGLASKCYTHFTSPIRRYPDLLVHRLIKEFMLGKKEKNVSNPVSYFADKVNVASITSSKTERVAESLERECVDFKKCEYMKGFIGKTFIGTISSITQFGVYIMLDNTVEGLVKYSEMYDDYYEVDETLGLIRGEKTRKTYRIGDSVKIRVMNTDLEKRVVEFRLLGKENKDAKKSENNCSK